MYTFKLEEASIDDIRRALEDGMISSLELVLLYLNRIYYYDMNGIGLNSIPLLNPEVLEEAKRMDQLRSQGNILGPLHGIPFTVKDSYMVKDMTVACGSPAFSFLRAKTDSFTVETIRKSGGILIGKTNMPPMAAGGMQRGLYGRAESPYNAEYLPAAWFSGSSNGSGVSTAANFASFGLAEETVSSGRSPASNNGLVAYTPSRGLLSIRGNWPLFALRDVVVPHTRSVSDLAELLDVIMVEDRDSSCDFWREQSFTPVPEVNSFRPESFKELLKKGSLEGKRIGVVKMYTGRSDSDLAPDIRPSIKKLWERSEQKLKEAGAKLVDVDFPLMELYGEDPIFLAPFVEKGLLPSGWMEKEWDNVNPLYLEKFLRYVDDPAYPSWNCIDPETVFPDQPGTIDEKRENNNKTRYRENISFIQEGYRDPLSIDGFKEAVIALEKIRVKLFEEKLKEDNLDFLIFPANCDIGRSDADINEASHDEAWKNGNFFSNTNHMLRHMGIPSVSVCMGVMEDTGMPVDLTIIGPAYSDKELIACAFDYEQAARYRTPAKRTPPLTGESKHGDTQHLVKPEHRKKRSSALTLAIQRDGARLCLGGSCTNDDEIVLFINGSSFSIERKNHGWQADVPLSHIFTAGYRFEQRINITVAARCEWGIYDAVSELFTVS